jgi:hypothetical protein
MAKAKGFVTFSVTSRAADWQLLFQITKGAPTYVKQGLDKAFAQEAEFLRGKMVGGLQSGSPGGKPLKPHSAATAAIRRAGGFAGTKILIRGGGMLGSIKVTRMGQSTYFIGILRGAKGAGGKGRVNLGQLHHTGKSWRMSNAQRRWLFGMLRKAGQLHGRGGAGRGGGGGRITIPARPFIPPVLEKWGKGRMIKARLNARLAKMYKGKLSK